MSRLATSFVLGYHGCDRNVGERAVAGDLALLQSERDYDWLGPGVYFWESDPRRALEWAASRYESTPYVVGAVIDLRNCLDLQNREDLEFVRSAYDAFAGVQQTAGLPLPENKSGRGGEPDKLRRYLDCAVIRHLHSILEATPPEDAVAEPYDTVRGLFTEGEPLFPGSGFKRRTHVQVAVRNAGCIRGLFVPRPYPTLGA